MDPVYFVTSNPGKVESANAILADLNLPIQIEMLPADYPEDKSEETTAAIAAASARWCADKHKKSVIVTDVGLFIHALKGFPGINTAFTLARIGEEGILKLMADEEDRGVTWELSLGFARPGEDPKIFTATTDGIIATAMGPADGMGFDPIFIAPGHTKTLAHDTTVRDTISPFREALRAFGTWYDASNS
ncbi:non-canonical purine NTP pyrophosphatase [bacterium]|nr:non-canonical purine NTP pyrophosphatase [bacterium]